VRAGQPVCVVETSKSAIEIVSPGAGTLCHRFREGEEVELGETVGVVAASEDEVTAFEADRAGAAAGEPDPAADRPANVTRRAAELAREHGIDLTQIRKPGFVTAEDVESLIAAREPAGVRGRDGAGTLFAGMSLDGVSLPASIELDESVGALDPGFLASLRDDPEAFRALPAQERLDRYRANGARIGERVALGERTVVVAPRIVLDDDVTIGDGGTVACEEVFAVGPLTRFGERLRVACRRVFVGADGWIGHDVRFGGGGAREPWGTLAIGDLAFVGDEVYVNPCRPVLIGREVFLTMRSVLVTHNVGHSLLEGFENRFAGVVLEDRSQVGIGTVVYAGCRIGREAIVASNSYVVSDIPAGRLAIGVPARVSGHASRPLTDARRRELVHRMLDELEELLRLRGVDVGGVEKSGSRGLELHADGAVSYVLFVERLGSAFRPPEAGGEVVVLTLALAGDPPAGCAVLDLTARRVHGSGGTVLDSVREFCRKRGIRFEPALWRYRGGLV
jgi:acetyltransferase-like isoleucine patch superfamily enzyme